MDFSYNEVLEHIDLNNMLLAEKWWGVLSGSGVSERGAGANMSVDVAAGIAFIDYVTYTEAVTVNVVISAADATNPRKDIIIYDSATSNPIVITGNPGATPQPPDITANDILLAMVDVSANATAIYDSDITDKRIYVVAAGLDVVNGTAGLDANTLLDPVVHLVGLEEYSNHLGATDNFTSTGTTGNGTATSDATNHKMVLSTGITVVGKSWFEAKPTYTLGSKPTILNYIVQSLVDGVGGVRRSSIGFHDNFGAVLETDGLLFFHDDSNNWYVRTTKSGSSTSQAIADPVNGDLLTIVATSSKVAFYKNGTLLFTSTTNIPTAAMQFGAGTLTTVVAASTARTIGIDMMSVKVYH